VLRNKSTTIAMNCVCGSESS